MRSGARVGSATSTWWTCTSATCAASSVTIRLIRGSCERFAAWAIELALDNDGDGVVGPGASAAGAAWGGAGGLGPGVFRGRTVRSGTPAPRAGGPRDRACRWRPCGHGTVSYTHLRAHETRHDLVCRLLLEKKKK